MGRFALGVVVGVIATVVALAWRAEAAAWEEEAGREHAPFDAKAIPVVVYGKGRLCNAREIADAG